MDPILGAIVGGLSSLAGSFMNTTSAQNIAAQNIAFQTEFAQNGIQWKVDDAKKAGINPLAALGAQTNSFSNIVGPTDPGAGVAAMGQNIARAMQAQQSPEDKAMAAQKTALDLESQRLDNQHKQMILASDLKQLTAAGNPPGIKMEPSKVVAAAPGMPQVEAGSTPDTSIVRSGPDSFALEPSEGTASRLQAGMIPSIQWSLRNFFEPPKKEGYDYNPFTAKYTRSKNPGGSPYTGVPYWYDYRRY